VQALRERAEVYKSGSAVHTGEITMKIDKPGPQNRAHGFAILNVPEHQSQEQYERTLRTISDRLMALPMAQTEVLRSRVVCPMSRLDLRPSGNFTIMLVA
jgi:hypothetical protein